MTQQRLNPNYHELARPTENVVDIIVAFACEASHILVAFGMPHI